MTGYANENVHPTRGLRVTAGQQKDHDASSGGWIASEVAAYLRQG